MEQLLEDIDIIHIPIMAYEPKENGVEELNRTVMNDVSTTLLIQNMS